MSPPLGLPLLLLLLLLPAALAAPPTLPLGAPQRTAGGPRVELEASGGGAAESIRGTVKVLQLDPRTAAQAGLFRRGLPSLPRRGPSLSSRPRLSFPAFLSRGRPAPPPPPASRILGSSLNHLNPGGGGPDARRRQGLQMWQRAVGRGPAGAAVSLPVHLKEAKQTCAAVPFVQRVTAPGCSTVTVHNRLCFGQCSSLFVPPEAESAASAGPPHLRHRAPCSRCGPSKARTVAVPLLCAGGHIQHKRALVVEECKCETGQEERSAEAELL